MILVDSNIIIDYWKRPTDQQSQVFLKNEVAICGVVATELLRGAQSEQQFNAISQALMGFDYLTFSEDDWFDLSRLFLTLRQNGIKIPFQDGIIAYLAMKNHCVLWTNDRHFTLIKTLQPELQLFQTVTG